MCVPGCEEAVRTALSRRGFFKGAGAAATAGFMATAVPAPAAAQAPRSFTRVIDLTHTMSPAFPTFFDVPGIEMQRQFNFREHGFNLFWWRIVEHAGTHLDAPIHFSADGATVDAIPAEQFVVPLVVVDVAAKAAQNADYQVTADDLRAWEAVHGRIPDRACVAMHSGWARFAGSEAEFMRKDAQGTFHFPGFAPSAAEFMLRERTVTGLGVDTASLDHGPSKDFRTHYLWLPSGRWGLENMANLDQVPPVGATLVVGQPKVKDATGGPSRLFALI